MIIPNPQILKTSWRSNFKL